MEARSNWVVESVMGLQDAIQESTTFPSEDLAELLDEEKCFSLTRPDEGEGDDWCHIRLVGGLTSPWTTQAHAPAGSTKLIKGVLLHSEARVVEVCVGAHDEYLKTVHGRRLGQYEDTEMSACEVQFDPPRQEVLLTLKHTYNMDCVWVFGLHVMTTEEPAKCGESRFGGGHLSSVLKEKDVNVSKDAARFLHMLESYNATNSGGNHLNENNQLALMSMFLGPKMLNKAPFNPGMFDRVGSKGGKSDTLTQSKLQTEESDISGLEVKQDLSAMSRVTDVDKANSNDVENRMKKLEITNGENNNPNISKKLYSEGNNITSGNLNKESCTSKTQAIPAAGNQDGLVEKLFTLMGKIGHGFVEQQNTQGQHSISKAEASPPPASSLDHLRLSSASSQGHTSPGHHTMQMFMESLSRIPAPNNNFSPSHSAIAGPAHSTPRARGSENNNAWPADGGCDGLSLDGSGLLLKEIENMLDQKFSQMEERLVKRIEQKAESDSKRLEKIEELLSTLCEHLHR